MRHSSWTLFLVPLALLPVLLIPGATQNTDPEDPTVGAKYEEVLADGAFLNEAAPGSAKDLQEPLAEGSEALFKD